MTNVSPVKLRAVEMERELFDNTLKELKNAEVLLQCGNLGKHPIQVLLLRMDNRLIGIVVEKSHCLVSW